MRQLLAKLKEAHLYVLIIYSFELASGHPIAQHAVYHRPCEQLQQ
jgi:hypothetical protein